MVRSESEILNVGMSKPPNVASRLAGGLRGAVGAPAPAGYEVPPRTPALAGYGTGRRPGAKHM